MGDKQTSELQQRKLETLLYEYELLKEEQTSRIGFRDNLLYVTLTLYGALIAFTLANLDYSYGLLVLPWVSVILGWNYLINDQKISAIGTYIRRHLAQQVDNILGVEGDEIFAFGWERAHRQTPRQKRRKQTQLAIDLITFVVSGLAALGLFLMIAIHPHPLTYLVAAVDALFLLALGIIIYQHADLSQLD